MNDFNVADDLITVKELLGCSDELLAQKIGVTRATISRWLERDEQITDKNLEAVYESFFKEGVRLNQIKGQLFTEEYSGDNNVVLFHGAKNNIEGSLTLDKSRDNNDFGKGFYCGESLEQSAMFVSNYPTSSLYIVKFNAAPDLKCAKFKVDRDWMLTIAYFRKRIKEYADHPIVKRLAQKLADIDYIVAPIADNRMYEIIDEFIDGEITDVQCQHCLSATNLGFQYVFVTEKALKNVSILRHCYLCPTEKKFYLDKRIDENKVGNDKVKVAKRQYRGEGLYIDQILK
jgi:transcriptional regulator with XRE-family HTH domain